MGGKRYPLPWREFHDMLPDNYQLSVNRFQGLLHRLKQDPAILKEYDDIVRKETIEAMPASETTQRPTHL